MPSNRKTDKDRGNLKTLKSLHGKKKLQYLWDYFKLPLVILCILLYVIIYISYRHFTYKEPILYAALVNVNAGETLTEQLSDGFLDAAKADAKETFHLYTGLYLTDDENSSYHEYTYGSRMKILASIEGAALDVVLMDKEAFDAFAQNGYLCNIKDLLFQETPDFYESVKSYIVENTYIKEDNASEVVLDPSVEYTAITESYPMGLDLSQTDFIKQAGFREPVYLGIISNSPRTDTVLRYVKYLFSKE